MERRSDPMSPEERPHRLAALTLRDPGLRSRLARALAWLVAVLFTFPGFFNTLGVGLDPSWAWAINTLPYTGRLPGRDVVFTYGPLGWLLMPAAIQGNLMWAVAFHVVLQALFAVGLARALRGVPPGRGFLFAGLWLASFLLGLSLEARLLLTVALLLAPELQAPRRIPWAPALAGALASFYVLLKMNLGVNAGALVFIFCALLLLRRRPGRGRAILAAVAGGALTILIAVPAVFGSPGNFLRWLGLEAEIVKGYAAAMRLEAPPADLAAGLLALGLFVGLCLYTHRVRGAAADPLTLLLLPAWLAFQHGFIRADSHISVFPPFLLAALALGLLFARGEAEPRAAGGVALAVLLLAIPFSLRYAGPSSQGVELVLGLKGWENLSRTLRPAELEGLIRRVQGEMLQPLRLPRELAGPVRRANLGVDALPWHLSYLAANDLRWVPNPTLQLYATYTARLDALAAGHFAGPEAPDLLFVDYTSIDERDMLWDSPETWRAILASYELHPDLKGPFIVARRRERPLSWQLQPVGEVRVRGLQWIAVPEAAPGEWIFAEVHLEPSWAGRLERLLLGVPPIYLQAAEGHGRRRISRILPETAGGGLLMSPTAKNMGELATAWSRPIEAPRNLRFRVGGPGMRCFQDEIRIRWIAGRLNKAQMARSKARAEALNAGTFDPH
jgi:hypothetical protein